MRYTIQARFPDSIELEMKLSMPLEQWKKLKAQCNNDARYTWPLCDFMSAIEAVVYKAEKHFEHSTPDQP